MSRYAFVLLVVLGLFAESESWRVCRSPWRRHGSNCYLFSTVHASWFAAQSACRMMRSKLAEPLSWSSSNYLSWVTKRYYRGNSFWLGGTDLQRQRQWKWVSSGRPIRMSRGWAPGEPNNYKGWNERCVQLWRHHNKWNDSRCTDRCYFICQKY